jgi:hypothetical protein
MNQTNYSLDDILNEWKNKCNDKNLSTRLLVHLSTNKGKTCEAVRAGI